MLMTLFIDLDGTLLDSKLQIPETNVLVLRQAIDAGAEVVFSTGRPLASAKRLATSFKTIRYLITSNGGCLADLKEQTSHCVASFFPDELDQILRFGTVHGLSSILYTVDQIVADSMSAEVYLEVARSGAEVKVTPRLPREGVIKVLFVGKPHIIRAAFQEIRLDSGLDQMAFSYVSYPEYLEVSPRRAGKFAAGQLLLEKLGRDWATAISFGDGANDVAIMKASATSVAVSNATAEAKAAATIIAPSNDEGGVAIAIRWLLFSDLDAKSRLEIQGPMSQASASRKPS